MEHKDLWLVNYIKERYLEGVQLPYNDDNMPTKYEIKIVGNMALVGYSYHSLMYPGDEGRGFLGYADENMCYW